MLGPARSVRIEHIEANSDDNTLDRDPRASYLGWGRSTVR